MDSKVLEGNIVDVIARRIFPGSIVIEGSKIVSVQEIDKPVENFILPGLVDAHVHIESSMLTPSQFASLAIRSGTTQCISDPHEIANVLGKEGVRFMIDESRNTPLKITFGVPSCVPATDFETSGSRINAQQVKELLEWDKIGYLSEVMNFPAVISRDKELIAKIGAAIQKKRVIDGHAPGLRGEMLDQYIKAGISTDHECTTWDEAEEKISKGMLVLIREGSAAKNLMVLAGLVDLYPEKIMFCTDDIHPDDLIKGHMNIIFRDAVRLGCDRFNVLRCMTLNPMKHYGLEPAMLQEGNAADIIVVNEIEKMEVQKTYINGELVYSCGDDIKRKVAKRESPNLFVAKKVKARDISIAAESRRVKVIRVIDGELNTGCEVIEARIKDNMVQIIGDQDVLKIVVLNRYKASKPSVGLIRGFGLRTGAMVSSIAHDSHNIICVGENDRDIITAINYIVKNKGGIAISENGKICGIPLPIAGIMTDKNGEEIAQSYKELNQLARHLGSELKAPFMTLSFMALLVIPELKISDKGLFDVNNFSYTSLFA